MKTMPARVGVLSATSLLLCLAVQAQDSAPEVLRHRLFDRMAEDDDRLWRVPKPASVSFGETTTAEWDFTDSAPEKIWYGRDKGRRLDWDT